MQKVRLFYPDSSCTGGPNLSRWAEIILHPMGTSLGPAIFSWRSILRALLAGRLKCVAGDGSDARGKGGEEVEEGEETEQGS